MKLMNQKVILGALCALGAARSASAKIYLDFEVEPLPLVEMSVVLPVGFETKEAKEAGAANLIPDILDAGSRKYTRAQFVDKLGRFGANVDFSVANRYSQWDLNFPVVEGKDYDQLTQVLAEQWATPRFDAAALKLAKLKLDSNMKGALDNDFSLAMSTVKRYINKTQFNGNPVYVESLDRLTLPLVQKVFARDFQKVADVWVGVVAPQSSLEAVKKMVGTIFKNQGEVVVGEHLETLPSAPVKMTANKSVKQVLILDKADRNQTVTAFMAVSPQTLKPEQELPFMFSGHIFFDSGLASVFGEEIRTKRGLAYNVRSTGSYYLNQPNIGAATNPLREKTDEAFTVLADLMDRAFAKGEYTDKMDDKVWKRNFRSYQFSKVLSAATPSARLSQRQMVVTGAMSGAFYRSKPEDWKVSRGDIKTVVTGFWNQSPVVIGMVGSATELKSKVEKYFPGYQIKVIPYRDAIREKTFQGI